MQLRGAIIIGDVSYPKSIQVHCAMVQKKHGKSHCSPPVHPPSSCLIIKNLLSMAFFFHSTKNHENHIITYIYIQYTYILVNSVKFWCLLRQVIFEYRLARWLKAGDWDDQPFNAGARRAEDPNAVAKKQLGMISAWWKSGWFLGSCDLCSGKHTKNYGTSPFFNG